MLTGIRTLTVPKLIMAAYFYGQVGICMNFYDDIDRYSERIAVCSEDGTKHTYGDLIKSADKLCADISSRSLVFLVCSNSYASIAGYIGLLRKRAVPILINSKMNKEMLDALEEKYAPSFVICPEGYEEGSMIAASDGYVTIDRHSASPEMHNELAVLLTTSGSTGSSKLVMQSYENICANAASIAEYLDILPDDRAITTMPMSYTYGLSIIQSHLLRGAEIIATESSIVEKRFWELLKAEKATTFGGVPYIYETLKKLRFERMELPSLRYLTQAGGKLASHLVLEYSEMCRSKGVEFIVMYGQTEATARMSYLPWKALPEKAGSIGIAIPGGEFSLLGDDGQLITEPDVQGELLYTGKNVTLGYSHDRSDLTGTDLFGDTLHTGDIAKRDSDGFYYITGRKKRMLKLFGNRVSLDETEELLKNAGYDCVCGGKDDLLTVYLVHGDDETSRSVISYLSEATGLNHTAFRTVNIDEIPLNSSGKTAYSVLEEKYGRY